jgi:hypothetical protein
LIVSFINEPQMRVCVWIVVSAWASRFLAPSPTSVTCASMERHPSGGRYDPYMGNSARELADMLSDWRVVPRGVSAYNQRGLTDGDPIEFWRGQVHAARLLGEVDSALVAMQDSGRNVGHYNRALESWFRGVFGPDHVWGSAPNSKVELSPQSSVDLLYSFADLLDATTLPVAIDESKLTSIRAGLSEIIDLIEGAPLSQAERRYVFELVTSVRKLLDSVEVIGGIDLLHHIHELFGFLTLLADDLDARGEASPEFTSRLRDAARKVIPYVRYGTLFGLSALDATANVIQITQGNAG